MFDAYGDFKRQLPDPDPARRTSGSTRSTSSPARGRERADFLLHRLLKRARMLHIGLPGLVQSRYINTISPEQEPPFQGDEQMEHRIRRIVRWNAVVMVLRANHLTPGLGGHLATYASAPRSTRWASTTSSAARTTRAATRSSSRATPRPASTRGRSWRAASPRAARPLPPGGGAAGPELPTRTRGSCPTSGSSPRSRWDWGRSTPSTRRASTATCTPAASPTRVPTASGPSSATARRTSRRRSARLALAGREGLDNLTFVVNCNLQRLDGPVRGNGKIIQELEGLFRGAGWNVIKVIWGREWDDCSRGTTTACWSSA